MLLSGNSFPRVWSHLSHERKWRGRAPEWPPWLFATLTASWRGWKFGQTMSSCVRQWGVRCDFKARVMDPVQSESVLQQSPVTPSFPKAELKLRLGSNIWGMFDSRHWFTGCKGKPLLEFASILWPSVVRGFLLVGVFYLFLILWSLRTVALCKESVWQIPLNIDKEVASYGEIITYTQVKWTQKPCWKSVWLVLLNHLSISVVTEPTEPALDWICLSLGAHRDREKER